MPDTAVMTVTVAAFYIFTPLDDCGALQHRLSVRCAQAQVLGTILLAPEGLNGTICGPAAAIDHVIAELRRELGLERLEVKFSHAPGQVFRRLKVKIKPEIVTLGIPGLDPAYRTGIEVEPTAWNELILDPDTILIDTRNAYEVGIGTFPGAMDPGTRSFRDFPAFVEDRLADAKDKRIAMFCTGGIRCEKASAYLLAQGFRDVYQLKGGILKYLEFMPESESRWQGACFVFDERVALDHGVSVGRHRLCGHCGQPFDPATNGNARACGCEAGTPDAEQQARADAHRP
jgi:UPF0176 protein